MIEGETLGTIGMGVGIFGLLVAFMLYRKVDSIEIENKTVAKITERIQDGAMAFMVAEYRMLTIFIAVVAALLFVGGSYNDSPQSSNIDLDALSHDLACMNNSLQYFNRLPIKMTIL